MQRAKSWAFSASICSRTVASRSCRKLDIMPGLGCFQLTDLQQVPIRFAEEASDLPVIFDGWSEEGRSASRQGLVGGAASGNSDRQLMTNDIGRSRWSKRDRRLVHTGPTSDDEQKPGSGEPENG